MTRLTRAQLTWDHPDHDQRAQLVMAKFADWLEGQLRQHGGYRRKASIASNKWVMATLDAHPEMPDNHEAALHAAWGAALRFDARDALAGLPEKEKLEDQAFRLYQVFFSCFSPTDIAKFVPKK